MSCLTSSEMMVMATTESSSGSTTSRPDPTVTISESGSSNNEMDSQKLREELHSARVDAKETLLALLQFSEGVRLITRHMQNATTNATTNEGDDNAEESKSNENEQDVVVDDHNNSTNPSLLIEQMVSETRLQGTIFGTDLLRLWDAAHHIRDYARSIAEESTLETTDILKAQQSATQAERRATKAESKLLTLHQQNQQLRKHVHDLTTQKRCLVQEVKTLRQQVATSRKVDMERLLQQHVTGAILLHEEQLKAAASSMMAAATAKAEQLQQQQQQQQGRRKMQEEEKKEEDEDMEVVVKTEDCCEEEEEAQAGILRGSAGASPRRNTREGTVVLGIPQSPLPSKELDDDGSSKPTMVVVSGLGSNKENSPSSGAEEVPQLDGSFVKDAASVDGTIEEPQSTPSTPSAYSPIKLFPSSEERQSRSTPPPPAPPLSSSDDPNMNGKPNSSRSVDSTESNYSAVSSTIEPPPEQPRENVGSKVFNFLFHPEKIALQRAQEMQRKQMLAKKRQQELAAAGQAQPQQQQPPRSPKKAVQHRPRSHSKPNPILALDDLSLKEDNISVDATAPTLAATTPGSTCASSSASIMMTRARSMSGEDEDNEEAKGLAVTPSSTAPTTPEDKHKKKYHHCSKQQQSQNNNRNIDNIPQSVIPNCVSFSDDTMSVQSNLPSPKFQSLPSSSSSNTANTTKHNVVVVDESDNDTPCNPRHQEEDVKVYQNLFRSLSIPADDEIDEYRRSRDKQQPSSSTSLKQ